MTQKILAAGSIALMGAGALLGATPANAATVADCGSVPDGAFVGLINDEICVVTFNLSSSTDWTVPDGIDRLAAVLVGGGGGSVSFVGVGYAGGGGEVIYVSDVDPADVVDIVVGEDGNITNNGDGQDSSFGPYVARGGEHGEWDSTLGDSGNGNAGAAVNGDIDSGLYGGGAKTPATPTSAGEGYLLSDPELTEGDELFPAVDGAHAWGAGGGLGTIPNVTGYGEGASATAANSSTGTQGAVMFRWNVTDVQTDSDLAATGVDANTIGITAGVLGAAGVGLAVLAAARRARREK